MRRRTLSRLRSTLACLILVLGLVAPVTAQPATPVASGTTTVPDFPTGITFEVTIPVGQGVKVDAASLFYRVAGDPTLNEVTVAPNNLVAGDDSVSLSRFVDLQTAFVPPGVPLEYFWEIATSEGTIATTPETVPWIDSRFDWDVASSNQITLHSYGMSSDFVSWMLDQSQQTLDDLESRYGLEEVPPISIWVYPDSGDFSGTRQVNTRESIAGISYPGSSLIVSVVPDGNKREFGRVIPHEISHQALFRATANPFAPPPLWFDEGLATHYQTGGTDHYAAMVWRAATSGTLFDIASLNVSFPFQPAQATLAYAASWSMVDYLEKTYGADGIARVIAAFGEGYPADEAMQRALGLPIETLNANWHQWVLDQGEPGG